MACTQLELLISAPMGGEASRVLACGMCDRVAVMDVSLLYFDGCPNHDATLTLLQGLLADAGWDGEVDLINVESQERAEELSFRGSPTVLIDGVDPVLDADAPGGLSCRIFATDEG